MRDFDWEILVSLYQTKNITRSADALFLTQPALTKRIQAIEEELGCTILLRSRRGISFTPEGERIIAKAHIILNAIQEVHQEISDLSDGSRGTLSLGVPYSFVRFLMPSLLERYVKLYPNVDLQITTALSDELIRKIQDGTLDVCFARYAVEDSSLVKREFSEDQIYAVYSQPFCVEDLPNIPYIEFTKNDVTYNAARKWWSERFDVPQTIRFKVYNGDTCLSMIQHGLGYGIFPDRQYFIHEKDIYAVPLVMKDGTRFTRKTWLLHQKTVTRKAVARNFLAFLENMDIDALCENQ